MLPLPFARVAVAIGPPQHVPRDLPGDAIEAEAARLGSVLDALEAEARQSL